MKNLKKYILIVIVIFTCCFMYVSYFSSIVIQKSKAKNEKLSTIPTSPQKTSPINFNDNIPINSIKDYKIFVNELVNKYYVRVKGEIGSLRSYDVKIKNQPYKDWYFNISDNDDIISCYLRSNNNVNLQTGQAVIIKGTPAYRPNKSDLIINVDAINIVGAGKKWKHYTNALASLKKDDKKIPKDVNNIGFITSITSQAYTDFYTILDYTIKLLSRINIKVKDYKTKFYSASMGGGKCTQSIIDAIEKANNDTEFQPDILVISRGGGSIESMWCFNNEQLAEAIYNSKIPVLSAVGHERDVTLCDKAADMRASTPSHAGMMIAEHLVVNNI